MQRFILALLTLAFGTIFGLVWLTSEPRVQHALGEYASAAIRKISGVPVEIAWIYWAPLSGTVTIGDVAVVDRDGDAIIEAPLVEIFIKWGTFRFSGLDIEEIVVHGFRTSIYIDEEYNVEPIDWLLSTADTPTEGPNGLNPAPDGEIDEKHDRKSPDYTQNPVFQVGVDRIRLVAADLSFAMADPHMAARVRDGNVTIDLDGTTIDAMTIDLRGVSYEILDWRYRDISLAGDAKLTDAGLSFEWLNVHIGYPQLDAVIQMDIPFADPNRYITLNIEAQIDTSVVNLHYTSVPELLGTAGANVKIDVFEDRGIEMSGRVDVDSLLVEGESIRQFSTDFFLYEDGIRFDKIAALAKNDGSIASVGKIEWYPDIWLTFDTNLRAVDLDYGESFAGTLPLNPEGNFSGNVSFRFDIEPVFNLILDADGVLDLEKVELIPNTPVADLSVSIKSNSRLDETTFYLDSAIFSSRELNGSVTAYVDYGNDDPEYGVFGTAEVFALDKLGLENIVPISGRGLGSFDIVNDVVDIRFQMSPLTLFGTPWASGIGRLRTLGDVVKIDDIVLKQSIGEAAGWISYSPAELQGGVVFDNLNAQELLGDYDIGGRIDGDVQFSVASDEVVPVVVGNLKLANFVVYRMEFGDLTYEAEGRKNGVTRARLLSSTGSDLLLSFDGVHKSFSAYGSLAIKLGDVESALLEMDRVGLEVYAHAYGSDFVFHGFLHDTQSNSDTSSSAIASMFFDRDGATLALLMGGRKISGRTSLIYRSSTNILESFGVLTGTGIEIENDYSLENINGQIKFALETPLDQWNLSSGTIELDSVELKLGMVGMRQLSLAEVSLNKGSFLLKNPIDVTTVPAGHVAVMGGGRIFSAWNVDAQLDMPLDVLVPLGIGLREADGNLKLNLEIDGDWQSPQFSGSGFVVAKRMALVDINQPIDDVSGRLKIEHGLLTFENIRGALGDGRMSMRGGLSVNPENFGDLEFDFDIDSNRIRINRHILSGVRGKLKLLGHVGEKMALSGHLNLFSFLYDEDISWERALLRSRTRTPYVEDTGISSPQLDLKITGRQDLELRTNLLRGRFETSLDVGGSFSEPIVRGVIDLGTNSEFFFRGKTYRLKRGTIQMQDPTRTAPFLDIEAETDVRYRDPSSSDPEIVYRIRLTIFGPVEQLQIRFESDPPLDESDILTLLSLGILSSELSADRFDGLELSSIILSEQISRLEREIQTLIGFDRIEIEPAFDNSQGSSSLQVTLQKQLAKNFSLRLGTALDANADQRIELGYRIGRGFDLSVGWDNRTDDALGNFFTRPRFVIPLP